MDIDVFARHELDAVLRVLRTALRTDGPLDAGERGFLDTYAAICGHGPLAAAPAPIAADGLPLADPHRCKRLLQLAALAVLLARPLRPASVDYLHALARALRTHDPVLGVIDAILQGRRRRARWLSMRRLMRALLHEAWRAEGAAGPLRLAGAMLLKAPVNRAQMERSRRLGLLPEGTLGRAYWRFMVSEGFRFPGEPAGIPASVAFHDVAHVLAGHPATPGGEIRQGCFQAGNRREDGFVFAQMAVVQFHQGLRVTPATAPAEGLFDPAAVLWAIQRGALCKVDMTRGWDYWPLMTLPLEEARRRCALPPPWPPRAA